MPLQLEIVLELIEDFVILFHVGFIVVLVKFAFDVLRRLWVLMWERRVYFIVDVCVLFKESDVRLFLRDTQKT